MNSLYSLRIKWETDLDETIPEEIWQQIIQSIFRHTVVQFKIVHHLHWTRRLKGYFTFLEIGLFYNSPRDKQLSFTVFKSIQPIF